MGEDRFWLEFRRVWLSIGGLIKKHKVDDPQLDDSEFWAEMHRQIKSLDRILDSRTRPIS